MNRAFSNILILLLIIVILLLVAGWFYFSQPAATPQATPEQLTTSPTPALTTATPTSTSIPTRTVEAGGAVSFPEYSATVPTTWADSREHDEIRDIDRLTLTRNGYKIRISQAATGGSACLYPGDSEVEGPSARYDSFVEIEGAGGKTYRRGGPSAESAGATICEQRETGYFQPTGFGHINYEVPEAFDGTVVSEMDVIIASLSEL